MCHNHIPNHWSILAFGADEEDDEDDCGSDIWKGLSSHGENDDDMPEPLPICDERPETNDDSSSDDSAALRQLCDDQSSDDDDSQKKVESKNPKAEVLVEELPKQKKPKLTVKHSKQQQRAQPSQTTTKNDVIKRYSNNNPTSTKQRPTKQPFLLHRVQNHQLDMFSYIYNRRSKQADVPNYHGPCSPPISADLPSGAFWLQRSRGSR